MASQYALAAVLFRARYVAGREIRPLHVALMSNAPARHRELGDPFGARRLDFGVGTTAMTLASDDLSLPLPDADARLGAVLRQHAADVIAAQASSWSGSRRPRPGRTGSGRPSPPSRPAVACRCPAWPGRWR
jgi:hypothetical protein